MILQTRVAVFLLITGIFVCSGQTCREHSAKNSAAPNVSNVSNANSPAIMSNQNQNKTTTEKVVWGGPHVRLVLTSNGGEVEFDCAHGVIKEPLKLNEQGRFAVVGSFVREGGPTRSDESESGRPARYSGRVEGDKMLLTVTLTDSNENLDEFSLTRGSDGRLWKCK
jgi:hypothetical protein